MKASEKAKILLNLIDDFKKNIICLLRRNSWNNYTVYSRGFVFSFGGGLCIETASLGMGIFFREVFIQF